jgi:hypothetical protein
MSIDVIIEVSPYWRMIGKFIERTDVPLRSDERYGTEPWSRARWTNEILNQDYRGVRLVVNANHAVAIG